MADHVQEQKPAAAQAAPASPAPIIRERGPVFLRQKLALVLFILTVPILAMDYWQNGGRLTFFGEVPLRTLAIIACIGGAVSFLMYGTTRELVWSWFPGAVAGFGGFYSHILYTTLLEKEELWNGESIMIAAIGALPGILMYWGMSKILRPRSDPDA
jgi:hypothetical protein